MTETTDLNRRGFLKISALAGSGLILGCTSSHQVLTAQANESLNENSSSEITAWLHIDKSGQIAVMVPSSEMGQGVYTALTMIVAEELDADWQNIKVDFAPLGSDYEHPEYFMQATGGSSSVRVWWEPLREVGAAAREMLVSAAAQQWKVSESECRTENGMVIHSSGKTLGYGALAQAASQLSPSSSPQLKSPDQFRIIGKSARRLDTSGKVTGQATFGIDIKLPGMVYATVAQSPVFGGKLLSMDEKAAKAVQGVSEVVTIPNGIAVVADSYWNAKQGLAALVPQFDEGEYADLSSEQISKQFRGMLDEDKPSLPEAAKTLDLEYELPYLAHATMEPMNCTADVKANLCEIWVPTQTQTLAAKVAADITGLSADRIKLHTTFLGGGFGRRLETDFVRHAVTISKAIQKPVKVVWSREEDIQHDYYRPAAVSRFQIGLNTNGIPEFWYNQNVSQSILKRVFPEAAPGWIGWLPLTSIVGDPLAIEGAGDVPYGIDDKEVDHVIPDLPIPVGFWRSVGHSLNGFFVESAIDEAAHAAKQDPYQYRRKLLLNQPRHRGVLDLVAEKANWGSVPAGRFQGIALHKSFESYVAEVAEISVDSQGKLKIHKVVCAVDCGVVVNPDIVKAQMESGIVFGLVAAFLGEITIKQGRVQQSNFHDYQMLRMADVPPIEVHIVPSTEPPTGVGEPGVPPIAPAVTNAIYAATGKRIRSLPLSKYNLTT